MLGEWGDAAGGTARPPGPPARRRGVSRPGRSAAQPGRGGDPQSAGDAVVGGSELPRATAQHPAEA